MIEDDASYYRAAGRSLAAIQKYVQSEAICRTAWAKFSKRYGAENCMLRIGLGSQQVQGLCLKEAEGWRRHQSCTFIVPNRKTEIGRTAAKEMAMLPVLKLGEDAGSVLFTGCAAYSPGFEKLGDVYIIKHHIKADAPLDAVPIKKSEYWAMKEKEHESKQTAKP